MYSYQTLETSPKSQVSGMMVIGAVVAVIVGTATFTSASLYGAPVNTPATARSVSSVPHMNARIATARSPVAMAAQQPNTDLEVTAAQVQVPQAARLSQTILVPLAALFGGVAAYLWTRRSNNRWAMAAEESAEAPKAETTPEPKVSTEIVGKSYKSTTRAESFYGKPAAGATGTTTPAVINPYKPPVGAYDAASTKTYTPTTDRSKSYLGQSTSTPTAMSTYAAPTGAYDAVSNKTYAPTTSNADSFYGADQGQTSVPPGAMWYGPDRPKWFGPFSKGSAVPDYLKGEMPGDYGWDTAGLGADPVTLAKYQEAELMHGRWAMLGALGCLAPEFMDKFGIGAPWFKEGSPVWFNAGADIFATAGQGNSIQSVFGHANAGGSVPFPPAVIFISQIVLMGLVEAFRASRITNRDALYPGKFFDPMGLARDPDDFLELKVKEIKNGRLAMMAMLGFYAQAIVTQKGPVQNLVDHIADPLNVNGLTQGIATLFTPGSN